MSLGKKKTGVNRPKQHAKKTIGGLLEKTTGGKKL